MQHSQGESPGSETAMARIQSPLLGLPNEVLQSIASLLPTDRDVTNLSLACKEIGLRVLAPDSTIWRARFGDKYDIPKGRSAHELRLEYQTRAIVLPQRIDFKQAENEQQYIWLEVIQTMITEWLALPVNSGNSKTYEKIRQVMTEVNFLRYPKRTNPSDLFCAVQLSLTPLALDPEISQCCGRSDYDIGTVYSYREGIDGPFIAHEKLELAKLLHMRSFWQGHLVNPHENTFFNECFSQLPGHHKPQARKTSGVSSGFSASWLGYYSCIHPLPDTLEGFSRRESCADLEDHMHQVDIMSLEIQLQPNAFWPDECNRVIPQSGGTEMHRVYFDGVQRIHGSNDAANPLFGFTERIAFPYGGIPGWTRICFAICEQSDIDGGQVWQGDGHWIHGYEGVILPGGNIMLGRWVDLKDTSGRGPFIFWDL